MMMRSKIYFPFFLLAAFLYYSCTSSSTEGATGTLSLSLSDAATNDYKAVYVTVKQVQVHMGTDDLNWKVVSTPNKTYNLLSLVNGVFEQLGLSTLETGAYTQIRLIIGDTADSGMNILDENHPYANYLIDGSDQYHELKVPSGYQTGIKLVHEFMIMEGLTTELILDFDVEKSVVRSGNSGNWILKPVIKVMDTLNKAIVTGVITDSTGAPLQGVRVTAQRYDQETHKIDVRGATFTNENGSYQMYLEPNLYTIVAYKDDFDPACSLLMAGSNEDFEKPFSMVPCTMGTITNNVIFPQGVGEQVVSVHFLKASPCDSSSLIEVKTLNVSESGSYNVDLPAGLYTVSASNGAVDLPSQSISTGSLVTLDFPVE